MFLLVSPSKSKFKIFHFCRTRVVRVALVSHLSHSCCTRVASVALAFHSWRSCRTRVGCVWHSCCKLD